MDAPLTLASDQTDAPTVLALGSLRLRLALAVVAGEKRWR